MIVEKICCEKSPTDYKIVKELKVVMSCTTIVVVVITLLQLLLL